MKGERRHLLLGVTGGIAAYKIPYLIRLLAQHDVDVKVVLTRAAEKLVGEETLRTLSGNPVFSDTGAPVYDMDHIRLAEWADLFLIAPATANTCAKIARGIADNLCTTLALSCACPVMVAPAMNTVMWENPATQDNLSVLKKRGVRVLPVAAGPLACGSDGPGRMISIETIAAFVRGADLPRRFLSKKVLIASGPTVEPLDPVRVLTNRSSGKMGAALAGAALCMGAEVTVVTGPAEALLPEGITVKRIQTAAEMADALHEHFAEADVCIMAAAVSDFSPCTRAEKKIRRPEKGAFSLELVPNRDIAAELGTIKKRQFLVCFSLETGEDEKRAAEKMEKKGCDMMVHNSVASSLGTDTTKLSILRPAERVRSLAPMSKWESAGVLLTVIADTLGFSHE